VYRSTHAAVLHKTRTVYLRRQLATLPIPASLALRVKTDKTKSMKMKRVSSRTVLANGPIDEPKSL